MPPERNMRPMWTVLYNIVSPENDRWVGTGWEFFDSEEDAIRAYKRHQELGNCPGCRPFHKTDINRMGSVHRGTQWKIQNEMDEKLQGAISSILSTPPGERVMRPDFGSQLDELEFENE